jgi:hypothetical protein
MHDELALCRSGDAPLASGNEARSLKIANIDDFLVRR